MRPVRILGIAPYEGMRVLMEQIALDMPDVTLTAFVGDLEPGVAIAQRYTYSDFDVVISRGGTAQRIREVTTLPVVEIELTLYDIIRIVKLAAAGGKKCAIVGFPSIVKNAAFLSEVLQFQADLYTIHNVQEAREAMAKLKENNCNLVLCDMVSQSVSQEYGIPAMLIASGSESITAAILQAVSFARNAIQQAEHIQFLESCLASQNPHLMVCSKENEISHECGLEEIPQELLTEIREKATKMVAGETACIIHVTGSKKISVDCRSFIQGGKMRTTCSFRMENVALACERYGIYYRNKNEVDDQFFNSFFGVTQSSTLDEQMTQYLNTTEPLFVLGEAGTGKDAIIRLLYSKSTLCNGSICQINCARLEKRGWRFLMENEASPLGDTGITIAFSNLFALSDAQFQHLYSMLHEQDVHRRNRLFFNCTTAAEGMISTREQKLLNGFDGLTVMMSPLRENRDNIPQLASLYISALNIQCGKEIIGFEPLAVERMQEYDWPGNYTQFKRILKELFIMTATAFIHVNDVENLLRRETLLHASKADEVDALSGLTLENAELLLIRKALERYNGNQTIAANALGISRSTLWRMLQKINS